MTRLTDKQVADAALNALDEFLDQPIESEFVNDNTWDYFSNGWSGFDDAGEWVEDADARPDSEDLERVQEEVTAIIGYVRDRTDGYYDQ